jgi:predicted house-cleaning noncanonical NTP pyrophosphatase (MazG superfamily)
MSEYIKVKDYPNLVRDKKSNAILNTDRDSLNKYKEEREYQAKIKRVVEENDKLKNDVNEIKTLLYQILGQKK